MINTSLPELKNPCSNSVIKKFFRRAHPVQSRIMDKDTIDEIIFRTTTARNRLILELMARAGYDPRSAVKVWQKMAAQSNGKSGPAFMSTHPSHDSRIKDLNAYAAKVMPLYQQNKR